MKILVVDVAAVHGGALSVLKQQIRQFECDRENQYVVCVSTPHFDDTENVTFLNFPWVKKSRLHRLFFDSIYIHALVKSLKPDRLLSLQNKGFPVSSVPQEVYFHNALFICEKRFSFREAKSLWVYQNLISRLTQRSLRRAETVYVQANWIKKELSQKWNLDPERITVTPPSPNPVFCDSSRPVQAERRLFYPASFNLYKNHRVLLRACCELWEQYGASHFSLALTGNYDALPADCKALLSGKDYPIKFLGRLSPEEMKEEYLRSVLAFPSYVESYTLPLLEARSLGCRILSSDCLFSHEILSGYENVCFIPSFDIDAWKTSIENELC